MDVVRIENLELSYSSKPPILSGLNLTIHQGSIFGFLGENGQGKSTTIKSMLGLVPFQKGQVNLFGHKLSKSSR